MNERNEIEIKCPVRDLAAFQRTLKRLHARDVAPGSEAKGKGVHGRVHEMNFLYDTPQGGLSKHGQLLRVRIESLPVNRKNAKSRGVIRAILTYKGPALEGTPAQPSPSPTTRNPRNARHAGKFVPVGRHKVREEIEVEVADAGTLAQILEALGLRGWFRYEKFCTTYRLPASVRWANDLLIEVDETPIGVYVELEGPAEAIDRAAMLLGFTRKDYITKSYLALYLDQCRARGIPAGDMLFPSQK